MLLVSDTSLSLTWQRWALARWRWALIFANWTALAATFWYWALHSFLTLCPLGKMKIPTSLTVRSSWNFDNWSYACDSSFWLVGSLFWSLGLEKWFSAFWCTLGMYMFEIVIGWYVNMKMWLKMYMIGLYYEIKVCSELL